VSECLRQAHKEVRGGGARPPLEGCRGAEPSNFFFFRDDIFFLG
jgi:hypothetical protein